MIAEIICVGTELLMGQIVNTNAQFMAEKLAPLGVDLYRQQVVGDNPQRLTEAVLTALDRSDVVLFSGGLGPTEDDLTKETVAAALGLFLLADIRITSQADGVVAMLRIPLTALLIAEVLMLIWLFPVMAAFADSLPRLFRNSFYFALKRAWTLPILLFFHVFPFYLTYTDPQMQPLYAFIWAFFGFSLLARLDAKLMLPVFVPYLPRVDEYGDMILEPEGESAWELPEETEAAGTTAAPAHAQKSEKEILEEMQKLGM